MKDKLSVDITRRSKLIALQWMPWTNAESLSEHLTKLSIRLICIVPKIELNSPYKDLSNRFLIWSGFNLMLRSESEFLLIPSRAKLDFYGAQRIKIIGNRNSILWHSAELACDSELLILNFPIASNLRCFYRLYFRLPTWLNKFNSKPGSGGVRWNIMLRLRQSSRKMHPQITRKFICFYYASVFGWKFISQKSNCCVDFHFLHLLLSLSAKTKERPGGGDGKAERHKP